MSLIFMLFPLALFKSTYWKRDFEKVIPDDLKNVALFSLKGFFNLFKNTFKELENS